MRYYTTDLPHGEQVLSYGGLVYFEWESCQLEIPRVLKELEKQAQHYQANAIIGLKIQVNPKSNGELLIFACGTAVQLDLPQPELNVKPSKWFR